MTLKTALEPYVQALLVASYLLNFLSCVSKGFDGNRLGLCDAIRRGNRIGLIRIYAHILLIKGTYLLVIELRDDTSIVVGKARCR